MAKILIVEDERAINDLVALNLRMTGHVCTQAKNGREALAYAAQEAFDLMLLDVMLPDMDGFGVLERVRGVPTIFLTARGAVLDKMPGFGLGADDYIVKPFEVAELLMRTAAVLRRTRRAETSYRIGELTVQYEAKQVFLSGRPVELTPQEFTLLEILIENRNIALSRQRLLSEAWGADFVGESRTVDVHIQKLRKKLHLEDRIRTVYKTGYRFEDGPI